MIPDKLLFSGQFSLRSVWERRGRRRRRGGAHSRLSGLLHGSLGEDSLVRAIGQLLSLAPTWNCVRTVICFPLSIDKLSLVGGLSTV